MIGAHPCKSQIPAACRNFGIVTEKKRRTALEATPFHMLLTIVIGVVVGIGASFSGLGGGFLMVPLLLFLGYTAQKAVGTSFMAILVISVSALIAHNKFANVDYRAGLLLGIGGVVGAQIGARIVEHVSMASFKKIFAVILLGLATYLFFRK
jgi:uncharacterized membrane protein YfcA